MKKKNGGITLIALVVTIVVLLILAGVSISMLGGENGIITQANNAKTETRAGEVEDKVNIWKTENNLYKYSNIGVITENAFIKDLKEQGLVLEGELDEKNKIITIGTRQISYAIEESMDFDEIIKDLKSNPDKYLEKAKQKGQTKEYGGNVGIGTNKEIVNLDLWEYNITDDGLGIILGMSGYNSLDKPSYIGDIVDGKIIGEVPQYIYLNNEDMEGGNVYPVTQMKETFINNTALEEAPKIPDTIVSIGKSTFAGCINLKSVEIPNSVTTIGEGAFAVCTNLTNIEIPISVTNIGDVAFALCSNLKSIIIPISVTNIGETVFYGWTEEQTINCEITKEEKLSGWKEKWDYYDEDTERKAQLNWGVK